MKEKAQVLVDDFKQYFKIQLVTTEDQLKQAYELRYRVYCEEFNYEATELFPNKMESDEFDFQSLHCLIIHKETGRVASCIRLVPAGTQYENGLLPLEKFCKNSLDQEKISCLNIVRDEVCEISRLAVDVAFRRRPGENAIRFGGVESIDCTQQEQRTFSLIALSAFLAGGALTSITHKTNVFAMMEPFLPRLLKKAGLKFKRVGEDMDYHGIRAPYFLTFQSAKNNFPPEIQKMYDWIYTQLDSDYKKKQSNEKG